MRARIRSIRWEADGINAYSLEPLPGEHLPPFEAGAHIDVRLPIALPSTMARSYSLINSPAERDRYEIAVQRATDGRGGSRYIHEHWRAGDILDIAEPRNNFPLEEKAHHTVLIAGGIGITPMLSMIARLEALGRSWELHYVVGARSRAAFLDRLSRYDAVRFVCHEDPGVVRLDMQSIIAAAPPQAHIYCCGPARMLAAFESLSASIPEGHAHKEYFSADTVVATEGGYVVELHRSGQTVPVAAGETMLDALLMAGANVAFACTEGVCGTCEVKVLDGVPDHRDHFLTEQQKASNRMVMVCCSGSKTSKLVLDL
jgi:vanillate O-demethylase ferredoxin subunit